MGKKQNKVGVKKDYNKMFTQMQKDLKGVKSEVKKEYYKDFYKSIAKAADQRLVELERLSKKEGYKEVTQWAYREAMHDIRALYGENAKRFNRKLPDNLNKIYKNINRVLKFLGSPTSSKQGIDVVYQKRANTIQEKYDVKVSWSDLGDIFNSMVYTKTDKKHGSKTVLKALAVIQKNKKAVKKELKEWKSAKEKGKKRTGKALSLHVEDKKVEETVNALLHHYKKDLDTLINDKRVF